MLAIGTPIVIKESPGYGGRTGIVTGVGDYTNTIKVRLNGESNDLYFSPHKVVPTGPPQSQMDTIAAEYVALTNLKPYGSNE